MSRQKLSRDTDLRIAHPPVQDDLDRAVQADLETLERHEARVVRPPRSWAWVSPAFWTVLGVALMARGVQLSNPSVVALATGALGWPVVSRGIDRAAPPPPKDDTVGNSEWR